MTDAERSALERRRDAARAKSDKYKRYYNSTKDAVADIQKARNGFVFMIDDQIPAINSKMETAIHPNDDLYERMKIKDMQIQTDLDDAITSFTTAQDSFNTLYKQYDSIADDLSWKLFWG